MKRRVIQLCNWDLKMIERHLPMIKEAGFTTIQTSPLQPCKPIWTDNNRIKEYSPEWYNQIHKEFWKNYQIYDFSIGNHLGSEKDYISLCEKAHEIGLEICVDVVLRHLAGDDYGNPIPHQDCNKDIANRKDFFMNDNRKADNFEDRDATLKGCLGGLPTLNYENKDLQKQFYLPFLLKILKYGDGIRVDMCHHFGLPSESFEFFDNVIDKLPKNKYISGECNSLNDYQLEEYSKYVVPILHYGQWYGHENGQYYMENHDTVLSFLMNLYMSPQVRLTEYENALRRNGDTLFYARQNDELIFSEQIKELHVQYK